MPGSSRSCRGPAATTSGRPGSSTGSRAPSLGALVGRRRRPTSSAQAVRTATPARLIGGARRRRRRRRPRLEARRHRLRPRRRPAGGSSSPCGRRSTAHPQDRGRPAARSPCWAGPTASTFFASSERHVRRLAVHDRHRRRAPVALGMAGYARVQRWCIWIGLIGARRDVRPHAGVVAGPLPGRLRQGQRQSLFGVSDAYNATIANADRERRLRGWRLAARLRAQRRHVRCCCRS